MFSFEQVTFYNAMIMDDGLSSCSNALYIVLIPIEKFFSSSDDLVYQPCLSFIIPKGVATDEMT